MIKLSRIVRDYKHSGALHAQLSLFGFIGPNIFLTKSGDLGAVLRVRGIDYECLDPAELDQIARRFETTLKIFDQRFVLYQYFLRRDHPNIPHESYSGNPVLDHAVSTRIEFLESKAERLYYLETYFVILYKGRKDTGSLSRRIARAFSHPRATLAEMFSTEKKIFLLEDELIRREAVLSNKVRSFIIQLADFVNAELLGKEEAFRFFRRLLNYTPYKADSVQLKYDTFIDHFLCSETLECHRDHLRLEDNYVKILVLKDPPGQTAANLFKALLEIESNFIAVTEWTRVDNYRMRKRIQSARRHYHNSKFSLLNYLTYNSDRFPPSPSEMLKDDAAEALVMELGSCLTELDVNGNGFGRFSLTIVLYDRDRSKLDHTVAECFKVFSAHDASVQEERYNLLNAWLATVPGNHRYNLRYLYLLNTNYADLSFIFALHTGEVRNRHLDAEYLAVLETEHRTPYFLNLHHNDIAHSLVLGATGTGKSFFLNFLITHLQKYSPLTFIFDLGASYAHVTRLFRGSYVPVGIEERPFTINPFSLPPSEENFQFLFSFVKVLVRSAGYQVTGQDERDLYGQIVSLYEIERENRRLFTLSNILNRNLRAALSKWVEGGQYARLFDNVEDNLTFARFQCFEFEGMDRYPQLLEPLLFYILHRASAKVRDTDSSTVFKVFVMDEAWRFLRDPAIKLYITEALKTWRKHNAAMILSTQSRADLRDSGIEPAIVESCATRMFLSSPGIDRGLYREIFHLNETEADEIAGLIPKRQILIKRPDIAKIINLNVDPKSYWLYTNDPYDNERRRVALDRYGFEEGLEILAKSGG